MSINYHLNTISDKYFYVAMLSVGCAFYGDNYVKEGLSLKSDASYNQVLFMIVLVVISLAGLASELDKLMLMNSSSSSAIY